MNGLGERTKSWRSGSEPTEQYDEDGSWRNLGTSMSALSFGLAATAILVSMFLIIAIYEHLVKPRATFLSPSNNVEDSMELGEPHGHYLLKKPVHSTAVGSHCATDLSVLMPGQKFPSFIAQPAPLPCPREGMHWPPHN